LELKKSKDRQMHDPRKITDFSISTVSTEPLRGIVEIDTFNSAVKFELSEDTALKLCTDLERFLTQKGTRGQATRRATSPQPDLGTDCYVRSRHR
jgi:hypothetical protein